MTKCDICANDDDAYETKSSIFFAKQSFGYISVFSADQIYDRTERTV